LTCVFAASDTFRAASIEQLGEHAKNLGIEMIKHNYGADPAAVAFDAIKHAKARGIDVVLIDTAGRQHANVDLMAELQKIKRVAKPNLTILTVDSLTGNDAVEQARLFNEKIGIDSSILAKVDADEKGGALLSVAYTTKKPILFLGVGQRYEDIEKFEPEKVISRILG
jgi:fused signal recognition particle receptor